LEALLVTVTVPFRIPVADGVKVTSSIEVCPGVSISPVGTPLAENPAPEMLTFEIAISELPALVTVTPRTPLPPSLTVPKLRLVLLAASEFAPVPALVSPAQPERNGVAKKARKIGSSMSVPCLGIRFLRA
jgi:hypothetical protein